MYLHIDPESKQKECPWYARGFCKHGTQLQLAEKKKRAAFLIYYVGPNCRNKHVRKLVCQNYLTGFCPNGLNCPNGHPKYELPVMYNTQNEQGDQQQQQQQQPQQQNTQDQPDHKLNFRHPMHQQPQQPHQMQHQQPGTFRKLEDVTCYKCGQQGHYANRCPQGRAGPPK